MNNVNKGINAQISISTNDHGLCYFIYRKKTQTWFYKLQGWLVGINNLKI